MKKFTILFFTALTMLYCKKTEEKTESTTSKEATTEEKKTTSLEGCYVFNDVKNIIQLEITENGTEIKGNLVYSLAEKDANRGNFVGKLTNDILIGKYTFQSEGKESTREVAFKIAGDTLHEGYGDLNEDGTTFKDATKLTFNSKMPLVKTNCVKE